MSNKSYYLQGFNILFFSCGVVTWGSAASVYGGYSAALCGALIFAVSFLGIYVALKESYRFSNYVSASISYLNWP